MTANRALDSNGGFGRARTSLLAVATVLVLVGISLLPFLTPAYVRLEQDRTGVPGLTGFDATELDRVAGVLLGDLVLWRGDFRVEVDGAPVLNEREVAHMRDVRGVLWGGLAVATLGAALVAVSLVSARAALRRAAVWRAVAIGARATTAGVLLAGALAVLAFPVFFELFHRLFFRGGTYTFDPGTERLVQLFPTAFWSETTIAIGAVVLGLSIVVGLIAGRRARSAGAQDAIARGWSPPAARTAGADTRSGR